MPGVPRHYFYLIGAEMDGKTASGSESLKTNYKSYTKRKILFIAICLIIAFSSVGISVSIGGRNVEFFDVYSTIYHHIIGTPLIPGTSEWMDDYIIWNVRLPRAVFAAVAGAGLAVGGAVMQSVMKNPLADPYTTGVSSGACFGVAVGMVLGFTAFSQMDQFGLVLNAFIFALIPMIMIIMLSPLSNSSPATLILAGVAISYLFNALNTLLLVTTDAETLATVYRWQIGSLVNITWDSVPLMAVITISGIGVISFLSKKLNLMALGDAQAKSLGLDVNSLRIVCLVIMSLMTASVIAYAGIIGFVGLISPHIVRMIIDADNRFVIPASAAFGAAFLMVADIISRMISDIGAIPVGVVISFVGAPIFLYLIIKQGRHIW
jgi:iron complex transport system permease protein